MTVGTVVRILVTTAVTLAINVTRVTHAVTLVILVMLPPSGRRYIPLARSERGDFGPFIFLFSLSQSVAPR